MADRVDPHLAGALTSSVLRQLPLGLLVAEAPGGRVVHGSDRLAEIWRGEIPLPASIEEYAAWCGFHADGRPYRAEEWPLARALLEGETVEGEEIRIERRDGTGAFISVSAAPILSEAGERVGASSVVTEITSRRRREWERAFLSQASARLASSLDLGTTLRSVARLALPELADWCAVDLLNEGGRIQRLVVEHHDPDLSDAAAELEHRYPPLLSNRLGVAEVLRSGRPEVYREIDASVLSGVAQDERHLELMRQLGLASVMVVPLSARDTVLGALVFAVGDPARAYGPADVALAEQLAKVAAMAIANARLYHESQAANRAKADFLAIISHELRTPLTAIIGYAELLGLGVPEPVSPAQLEQVERIEVSARHLLQLIEEILTMAQLETGRLEARSEDVPLERLLGRALVIVRPLAEAKDLTIAVDPVPEDLSVRSDPDKLLQILLNILSNAVKFTEQGGIRFGARAEGDDVVIEIADTGVGIAEEDWERVFQPFWQVEQPITRRSGGTGLGLAITQRLVALLGGSAGVESAAGEGSTFTIRLPRKGREGAQPSSSPGSR